MSENVSRQGGAMSWRQGVLKYRLPEICAFSFQSRQIVGGTVIDTPQTQRYWLRGVNANLAVRVVAAVSTGDRSIPAYPPLPGVCSVTPVTETSGGSLLFQKPLNLVPQTLPAAYTMGPGMRIGSDGTDPEYGTNGADAALIEITVDPASYAATFFDGRLFLAVTADYIGPWWDVETIMKLFGALELTTAEPYLIATGVD